MNKTVVTRFAPSPTGYMHIGNLRTALYAYLIARSQKGKFILRIEDTDRERLVPGAVEIIYDTLGTSGLNYDEGPNIGGSNGPYVQSERLNLYAGYAKKLVETGHAYYCFCTKERMSLLHGEKAIGGYDRHCRELSQEEIDSNLQAQIPYVIRQKAPLTGKTSYTDEVYGSIAVDNCELQDMVLLKADGYPTYNFAHVVDDHLMGVTHVVRGSEYVPSTPAYALLYDAFGWERPAYIHLPLIMGRGKDGSISKLSKRHGAVSFQDLVSDGYLPEAIINYIALLGWSPKDTNEERFCLEELAARFKINEINNSDAIFDFNKLLWFNSNYLRALSPERFAGLAEPYLKTAISRQLDIDKLLTLIQPRLEKLSQIPEKVSFFDRLPDFDCELFLNKKNKVDRENAPVLLQAAISSLTDENDWTNGALFARLSALSEQLQVKSGSVMWVVRIAASGTAVTPGGATEILEILGKEESLSRLNKSYSQLLAHKKD